MCPCNGKAGTTGHPYANVNLNQQTSQPYGNSLKIAHRLNVKCKTALLPQKTRGDPYVVCFGNGRSDGTPEA